MSKFAFENPTLRKTAEHHTAKRLHMGSRSRHPSCHRGLLMRALIRKNTLPHQPVLHCITTKKRWNWRCKVIYRIEMLNSTQPSISRKL